MIRRNRVLEHSLKLNAKRLIQQVYGTVGRWRRSYRLHPKPKQRNKVVLREIFRRFPDFREQLRSI